MRADEIAVVLDRKREFHPELKRGLTWRGFERICLREGIAIAFQALPREAQLVPFLGRWTIVLNKTLPIRRHTYRGVHELGHLWLHHDLRHDRQERVFNMDASWESDPREDDAELFAQLVLAGPRRSLAWTQPTQDVIEVVAGDEDPRAESHLQHALRLSRAHARASRR